jgi:hypothetical protein
LLCIEILPSGWQVATYDPLRVERPELGPVGGTLMLVLVLLVQWRREALGRHEFRMTVHEMMENIATGRGPL